MPAAGDGERPDMRRSIERDVRRQARREPTAATFWRSLSVLGTVGWSIALPTAGGALLGHYLDARLGSGARFTLILLTVGVLIGALLASRVLRHARD
jgi:ATP synthase protein I